MKGCFLFRKALALVFLALLALHGSDRAGAQANSSYLLLNNASATGPATIPPTGLYQFNAKGTFGGATVALVVTTGYGSIANTLWSGTSAPSAPVCVSVPAGGSIQATVTGGSPSGLTATLDGVGSGGCGSLALQAGSLAGGFEFNRSDIPTVQNASYGAGQSLGGLRPITIGTTPGLTGILTQLSVASRSGGTTAVVLYAWDTNPTSTTCTDRTNFVPNQADNQHLITGVPILLTPTTVVSAQDVTAYASIGNMTNHFENGSNNAVIYLCELANATVTPPSTTDYRINIQGTKDKQ